MAEIEQQARELVAAEMQERFPAYARVLRNTRLDVCAMPSIVSDAVRAVVVALRAAVTPPEGYVLVPVESLRKIVDRHETYGCEGYAHTEAAELAADMLAARPEVSP